MTYLRRSFWVIRCSLWGSILTAYDIHSGKQLWVQRIGGQISATPVSFDGLAFFIDEAGKTVVIDPESSEKVVATNFVGATGEELFRSSIVPCNGQLFIRSDRRLYCVGTVRSGAE